MKQVEEEFQRKLISPEEAANLIKSGDRIVFPMGRETFAIGLSLSARKEELKSVRVYVPSPSYDFGWYDPGWEDSFELTILMPTATADSAVAERRCDVKLPFMIPDPMTGEEDEPPDVVLVEISPPNEQGYCSFGASLWDKKRRVEQAKKYGKLVIAEVNENLIRTGGDNFVAINQTLAVDLTGQIASEGIGHRFLAAVGGQIPFVFGALLSKGGRSIITLPSTATTKDGVISRIMATLPPGTPVTIQRNCADYIVTEYGIASLRGKTIRQRVRELLGIAHPDFRAELEKEAKRLYWA
ncbi:hypothetical protein M1N44_02915 [Dehalococcoidia bacterium]|nr:hypothetical protein [Dehalococcoidia bacterium]